MTRYRSTPYALALVLAACGGGSTPPSTLSDVTASTTAKSSQVQSTPPKITSLVWNMPGTRVDSSPVVPSDIAGYRVYSGTVKDDPSTYALIASIDRADTIRLPVPALPAGTYYFKVTAIDSRGYESAPSNIVSRTIP